MPPRRYHSGLPFALRLFFGLYFLGGLAFSIIQGNERFIVQEMVILLVVALFLFSLHRYYRFSNALLWGLALLGFFNLLGECISISDAEGGPGSEPRTLYYGVLISPFLKYYHVVQFFGFGVSTWLCWEFLSATVYQAYRRTLYPSIPLLIICIFSSYGLCFFYQLLEALLFSQEHTLITRFFTTGSWELLPLTGSILAAFILALKR